MTTDYNQNQYDLHGKREKIIIAKIQLSFIDRGITYAHRVQSTNEAQHNANFNS